MLCYIDLEHALIRENPARRDAHLAKRMREKLRFEELSGLPCLVMHYSHFLKGWAEGIAPAAIILSGGGTDWSEYADGDLARLRQQVRDWEGPLVGFCAGHQLIAQAFGAPTGPMRPLGPGEVDPRPDYGPGLLKELGPTPIALVRRDPLFDGLPEELWMVEDHYWAVQALPPELVLLARTDACPVQAFRHRARPIYGTQFHPERYTPDHPHGRRLLENLFRTIGTIA
jgi:GMP synthase-like glutamine amidotransferase